MEELNKAIENTISKAQKATEKSQTLQSKKITPSNDVDTNVTEPSNNYHISKNLSDDLDNVLSNVSERNPIKLRDFTPDVLVQNGVKNLPMYENPSHIRKNILTDNEARELGLQISSRDHYHGLGKETYIKAIDSLDDPRAIFRNKNTGNYLILTVVKDSNNNNIVVPIEIETTTKVNNLTLDTNRVKTVYGYQAQNNINLNDYIKHNIKNNVFEKVYEQKKRKVRALAPQQSLNKVYHQQIALSITSICKIMEIIHKG